MSDISKTKPDKSAKETCEMRNQKNICENKIVDLQSDISKLKLRLEKLQEGKRMHQKKKNAFEESIALEVKNLKKIQGMDKVKCAYGHYQAILDLFQGSKVRYAEDAFEQMKASINGAIDHIEQEIEKKQAELKKLRKEADTLQWNLNRL